MKVLLSIYHVSHLGFEKECVDLTHSNLWPIYVRGSHEIQKVWVCLFTCLAIRAVHLEWITDLTAIQFLNCMRFVSHRGKLI